MDCLFCKIINKQIPSTIIYKDDKALAFKDVNPQAPVHILIIPLKHISTVPDIEPQDNELVGHLFQVANKIARQRGVHEKGFRLVMNCNKEAGQTIYHIHLHLLAGRPMHWPPG